jgi:hypothetical protein
MDSMLITSNIMRVSLRMGSSMVMVSLAIISKSTLAILLIISMMGKVS